MIGCCEGEVHYCCLKSCGVFYFSNVRWDHILDILADIKSGVLKRMCQG